MSDLMVLILGMGLLILCVAGFYLLGTLSEVAKTPGQPANSEAQPLVAPASAETSDEVLEKLITLWNRPAKERPAEPARAEPASASPASAPSTAVVPIPKAPGYFEIAPDNLRAIRALFSDLNRARSDRHRQEVIAELVQRLKTLSAQANSPELLPVQQIVVAFEGLLNQLTGRPADMSASALRTMAGALLVLDSLSRPGVRPDLATQPPIRLLVVDDDAVNRLAITFALTKLFPTPDVAPAGEAALALAAAEHYDVIFLDVEMPGMNGYELCAKLRASSLNHNTPVIFVTRHSDFESRARSIQSGGQDLVGKPFLPFEITLKALTFALRDRLQRTPPYASGVIHRPESPAPNPAQEKRLEPQMAGGEVTVRA